MPAGDHTFDRRRTHDGRDGMTRVDDAAPVVHTIYSHRKKPGPKPPPKPRRKHVTPAGLLAIEAKSRLTWAQQAEEIRALTSVQIAYLKSRRTDHLDPDDFDNLRVCAAIVKQMSIEQRQAPVEDPTDTDDEEKLEAVAEGR